VNIDLRTGGPHSPEYTQEVGNALAEAVRVLNYGTHAGVGLEYPADAYSLIGALYTATQRLPQLFGQMAAFLDGWQASGQLGDSNGADPNLVTLAASQNLTEAARLARMVTDSLQFAQNAIAGLYVAEGKSGTEGSGND
jgi:hypothetical protein